MLKNYRNFTRVLPWRYREVIKLLLKSPRPNAKTVKTFKEQWSRTWVEREAS